MATTSPSNTPLPYAASSSTRPMLVGTAFVILGGLVAAAAGPLDWRLGSWLAAYMVLVCGVAQVVIGQVPTWFDRPISSQVAARQLLGWNVGNILVMAGTLAEISLIVDLGGLVLLVALIDLLRRAMPRPARSTHVPGWAWPTYTAFLVVLIVSVPTGLVLSHFRVQ